MKLSEYRSPKDLKSLSDEGFETLAAEIRKFLVDCLSKNGGHLASNLGVVELTLALHTVFDSPADKIIWDVGHQSYVHKILTGRIDDFCSLRKLDGLSGFPKASESEHDAFNTGHSSTSISAAFGLAVARDWQPSPVKGEKRAPSGKPKDKVIAVIGDGSMTGGLAYEALNNAGQSDTDLLVIINDNQMSIAENVGAVSRHLNSIRTQPLYLDVKQDVRGMLENVPLVGKKAASFIETAKDAVKSMFVQGAMFEKLGFRYFGPVDGHNIPALREVLTRIKNIKGPVMLHVLTVKGKGYNYSESAPVSYHGVGSFCVDTGAPVDEKKRSSYTDVFGREMVKLASADKKIVAVTAAMMDGTGLGRFRNLFPQRFFDVGIAEGHAVTFAAGLAKGGLKPVVAVYSTFLQRAYDQILHDVCMQNLHVVFAVDRAGVTGADGETHQGLYDLSFLSHIPNMTIMAPRNKYELQSMLAFAVNHDGPAAVRYPRSEVSLSMKEHRPPIEYGRAEEISTGGEIALVSVGAMADTAFKAAEILKGRGFSVGIYNARFVKPMDMEMVAKLKRYPFVFVLEDNARAGGYGSRLLETMAVNRSAKYRDTAMPYMYIFAFPDTFVCQGTREEIFKRYRLDAESVAEQIAQAVNSIR